MDSLRLLADIGGAIDNQVVRVARRHPDRTRELTSVTARQVAINSCLHGEEMPRAIEGNTSDSRDSLRAADGGHKGLGGGTRPMC